MIRKVDIPDAERISSIYNQYIETSTATFEENPHTADEVAARIRKITEDYPWIVFEEQGNVIGYTYADKWKERSAYRHSVETAIYLDPKHHGKGIGTELKGAIIDILRNEGFHCVISGIALPNPASVALCEKHGFKKMAHFKEVGYKFGKWIDVAYWQLIL